MAEWHVSGSESEGEQVDDATIEVGKLRIPASCVAELLQTIEKRKTLDLECVTGGSQPNRDRKRKPKKHRKRNDSSAANTKSQEEVSETASELRSNTSTDTREGKWNNISHFDYFHEDSDLTIHKRQKKHPPGHKQKKLASLDQIMADVKQQREHYLDHQSITPEITLPYQHHAFTVAHHPPNSMHSTQSTSQWGTADDHIHNCTGAAATSLGVPSFSFDEDSDLDSPTGGDNMKMSVLSQINRVEKLLDDEGLT